MTREIIVNGRFLSRRITGVERYGREILSIIGSRCRVEGTRANGITGHAWEQLVLPVKVSRNSTLWSPANTGPFLVHNQALTVQDLSPLEHPEWFSQSFAWWYRLFLPMLAKRVRIVFTSSEYVRQKAIRRFGIENAAVVPGGVNTTVFHPHVSRNSLELPRKYILFVGSLQPRKNLAGLIKAWHEIKDEFVDTWLVVAGEAGYVFRAVKFFGDDRILFLNYVPEKELPALYANTDLLVLPSFDEGFGLPALEAMACGTPTLVSNGGALPEVVGDAGMIFDLTKPDDLSASIKSVLRDESLRTALREKGLRRADMFSWHKSAELVWSKLNEI
jgi:glycosyltransferase involved in cell wall biosynthesis